MTPSECEKLLSDLHARMVSHKVFEDQAIVEVTAAELDVVLGLARQGLDAVYERVPPGYEGQY